MTHRFRILAVVVLALGLAVNPAAVEPKPADKAFPLKITEISLQRSGGKDGGPQDTLAKRVM